MKKLIFAIDFDGSIVEHQYPEIGELKEDAKEVINDLYKKDHKIIIWTCRYLQKDLSLMVKFLNENNINFHQVNCNIPELSFKPYPKIYANIYIDDRNLFCEEIDWYKIRLYLEVKGIL